MSKIKIYHGSEKIINSPNITEGKKYNDYGQGFYYPKFFSRDNNARLTYRNEIAQTENVLDDIFVLDIIRQEMRNDDSRIQRIVSE